MLSRYLLEGSMGAAGFRESAGRPVYAWSEVEMRPLEPLTVRLALFISLLFLTDIKKLTC